MSSGSSHDIQQVLYRAAGYLVESGQQGSAELLHNICWIPVKTFTEESLVVGIAVWEWLLAERPDLGNRLMNGIGEAWAWVCLLLNLLILALR
jgi:phosphatidylinositol 4-kinase